MKKSILCLLAVVAMLVHSVSLNAQEKGDKKDPVKNMVTQFMKQLEKAELKEDETNKIKEMFQKVAKDVAGKRSEVGITPEMMKKRADAQKSAKEDGKKGKEMQQAVEAAMGMNADQTKVFKETEEMLAKVKVEIGKTMTADQIAKLPEQFQNALKEKAGKGKGKKADK
jgi:tRNA C32,U32 (ribose-2'-O)-methylase TrmJ